MNKQIFHRLISKIYKTIDNIAEKQGFKEKGYRVLSNDIQYYSYVMNKHLIENVPPLEVRILEHLNTLKGTEGFIYKNYCAGSGSGRNYFTDD